MRELDRSGVAPLPVFGPAPDFVLTDTDDRPVRLSDFHGRRHVVLIFNRGFT
jgi:peroxiredoxin